MRLNIEPLARQLVALRSVTLDNQAALETVAPAATSPTVRIELERGAARRRTHLRRLNEILEAGGWRGPASPRESIGRTMYTAADIASGAMSLRERDMLLIAWARRMLLDELAGCSESYECALMLGRSAAAQLLGQTLKEEYANGKRLVTIAEFISRGEGVPALSRLGPQSRIHARSL